MPFSGFLPSWSLSFSLQHQLYLPELSPQFLQLGSWAAFYQPFTCLCLPAVFAVSETYPIPICWFFSTESWVIVVGLARGRVGGAALKCFSPLWVMIVTSGRSRSIAVSPPSWEQSLLCWGFIWNFTRCFPAQCWQQQGLVGRESPAYSAFVALLLVTLYIGISISYWNAREFRCELLPCSRSPVYYSQKVLYWNKRFRKECAVCEFHVRRYKG